MSTTFLPEQISLFHTGDECFRLTIHHDRSHVFIRPVWTFPLTHPNRYLTLLDKTGSEVGLIIEPDTLDGASCHSLRKELRRRYLTANVRRLNSAIFEYGATYWHVETDRGTREFVTQHLQENAIWLTTDHLLILDVDGNRFEITSVGNLDTNSRQLLTSIV